MGNVHSTLVLAITLTSMISIDFQGFGWIWEPFLGDGFGYFCHLPMLQHKPVRCRCYTPDMVNRRLAMLPQWGQVRVAHVVPICSKSLTYPEILIDTHTAILCLCLIMEVPQNSLYFFALPALPSVPHVKGIIWVRQSHMFVAPVWPCRGPTVTPWPLCRWQGMIELCMSPIVPRPIRPAAAVRG